MTEEKHYPLSPEQLTNLCKLAGGKMTTPEGYTYKRCVIPGHITKQELIRHSLNYELNYILKARRNIDRNEGFIREVKEKIKEELEVFKERIKKEKETIKTNEIIIYEDADFSRVYGDKKEEREKGEKAVKIMEVK